MRWFIAVFLGLMGSVVFARQANGNLVLAFDGNDRVIIPDSPSLNPSEMTIGCRVNFARLAYNWPTSGVRAQILVHKGTGNTPGHFSLSQLHQPCTLQLNIGDKQHIRSVNTSPPLETNRWYHVAGTYDGQTMRLYLDGELAGQNVVGPMALGNSWPLTFGYGESPGFPLELAGQMDDVAMWNYARTAAELQTTMAGGVLTGLEAGLVGYWDFDEGTDNQTVFDATANANHGQLGSTPGVDDHDPSRAADPSALIGIASGNWNDATTWDHDTAIPTSYCETLVTDQTVTVAADGAARSLLINDSAGEVLIDAGSTLTVVNGVQIAAGSLDIRGTLNAGFVQISDGTLGVASTGRLNVDSEITTKVSSEYACELGASTSGLVTAAGNVHLDGTLTLQAIDAGVPGPRFDETIISSEGEILGRFAIEPTVHNPLMGRVGHLGLGVFHMGLNYVRSGPDPADPIKSVTVDLYVAAGGDGNGDGYVDVQDINTLVANFGAKPGENTWLENDCADGDTGRGDGYVDVQDINILVANFGTHPDPGPAGEGSAVAKDNSTADEFTVIPEPGTVVMLACAMLGLLLMWQWRWRAGRPG